MLITFYIRHGDENKNIGILKVDIEGYEFHALPQWLDSDILFSIGQIHFEIHVKASFIVDRKRMIESLAEFDGTYGFEMVHYAPNLYVERYRCKKNQYYTNFDLLLYKNRQTCIA